MMSLSPVRMLHNKPVRRKLLLCLFVIYLLLLAASYLVRARRPETPLTEGKQLISVNAIAPDKVIPQKVQIAFRNHGSGSDLPVIVLLHGSPGRSEDFTRLVPALSGNYRVIAPDLPGFGDSTTEIPDYSFRAHARYVLELLDQLQVPRAHFLGFSMGGGVVLNIAAIAPERVASLTLLSAIGVQEMELLGDYHLNHAVHGAQLAALWWLHKATPHFGWLDDSMLNVAYARNFYDSDQRPLRDLLKAYAGPMQIIHGRADFLVPAAAASEHHRLVPQSELHMLDSDHFMVFRRDSGLAPLISDFVARVEQHKASTRDQADPALIAASLRPFDPANMPRAMGVTMLVLLALIVLATLVSEDLTCISVGVLVAQGRIGFLSGTLACFLGIFVGDVLLFLAGRWLGRPALVRAPLRWFVSEAAVARSSAWFARNGARVIAASRFMPGMRLPTYFAAGALQTSFWWFTFYFALACLAWTPLLVGISAWFGAEVINRYLRESQSFLLIVVIAMLILVPLSRVSVQMLTWRGRRMLLAKWRRLTRWEFWPLQAMYPPVVAYIMWLALKHRSATLFTLANPAMPASGFVGESKSAILQGLTHADSADFIARAELIKAEQNSDDRIRQARQFIAAHQLSFPIVLKPDAGQRGLDVAIVRSEAQLAEYFEQHSGDTIIQEYVPGDEFGVFYYRLPEEEKGRIYSITEKRMPVLTGDGRSTLEQLILNDDRALCMARFYCDKHQERLEHVPAAGQRMQLVELGTHSRGAIFLDGLHLKTPELEAAIDRISQGYAGFYFGRYDIRTNSLADFQQGRNFKIIELNGVTSEATHIYDPKNSVLEGWRVLCEQWRIAFTIGAQNRQRGHAPNSVAELFRMIKAWRERN